jgi:hypothetical protein
MCVAFCLRYLLEDSSGSVALDLSVAQCTAGFFTENCVVRLGINPHIPYLMKGPKP